MIKIPDMIEATKNDPWGPKGLWIPLMLLSTPLPTFLHFFAAFIGVYTVYVTPEKWWNHLADKLKNHEAPHNRFLPAGYFTASYSPSLISAIAFVWIMVKVISGSSGHASKMLSWLAYAGIGGAGALFKKTSPPSF